MGVHALNGVQQWYQLVSCVVDSLKTPYLNFSQMGISSQVVDDSQHFLLEHFDTICGSPSHIYHSALPFCPTSSWLHEWYNAQPSQGVKVVKGFPARWGECSRTVSFNYTPWVFMCWKHLIAVGLGSGNISILDAATGISISALSGHTHDVDCLAFLSDGELLVSGSRDKTIKLWDIQTGADTRTFYGHTDWVMAISASLDDAIIASASLDKTVRLWYTHTGQCYHVISGHEGGAASVIFFPTNPQFFMSASGDDTIWQWDVSGEKIGPVCEGDYVAFSTDGSYFISWGGTAARVLNSDSGVIIAEFEDENGFDCCCISPSNTLMAANVGDSINVWDITTSEPYLIQVFAGHVNRIISLTFSSTLISSSHDNLLKFWEIGTLLADPVATDLGVTKFGPPPIESMTLQANYDITISSDLGGGVKIWDISTGDCMKSFNTEKGVQVIDARQVNGVLILTWHMEEQLQIWKVEKNPLQTWNTGEDPLKVWNAEEYPCQVIQMSSDCSPRRLRISEDGSKVFLYDGESIQAWSIQTEKATGEIKHSTKSPFDPIVVDGSKIRVLCEDLQTQYWDFGITGLDPLLLPSTCMNRLPLDFIHNATKYSAGSFRVKNTATGKEIFRLSGRYANPNDAQWDGRYLVAGYNSGEVLILDFSHMLPK